LQTVGLKHQLLEAAWRLAETSGRVLCIALFTSVFRWWTLAVLVPHVVLMFLWYHKKGRKAGDKPRQKWEKLREKKNR
jgi:hypothetical protein